MSAVTVAAVQAGSVLFNKEASCEKAVRLIAEASRNGARLVVFPESFIPCYPRGLSFGMKIGSVDKKGRADFLRYSQNAVTLPGAELDALCNAARECSCYVSMGLTEKDSVTGTLYCTNIFISDNGEYLGKHRKIKPTGAERCLWGEGGAEDLKVLKTPLGNLGCLICWENYMPLARTALYEQGVDIYIAPTADSRKQWQATVRHIAQEGRCFVISCNQFVTEDMYPQDLACIEDLKDKPSELSPGGSCIIDPTGKYLCEPVYHREEILYATLDLDRIADARLDFDPCGHYSRPDILKLTVCEI